jgi:hypothetical protein
MLVFMVSGYRLVRVLKAGWLTSMVGQSMD